jgi:hypothetical protein
MGEPLGGDDGKGGTKSQNANLNDYEAFPKRGSQDACVSDTMLSAAISGWISVVNLV